MNKVILSGNLTGDPVVRRTQSGKTVASLRIAVARAFSKDTADFFNMTAWDKQAEFCERYMKKGTGVIVEGRLENDDYEKDGVKHRSVRIQIDRIEFSSSTRRQREDEEELGGGVEETAAGGGGSDDVFDVPF